MSGWITNSNIDHFSVIDIQFALVDVLQEQTIHLPDTVDIIENRTGRRFEVGVYRQAKNVIIDFGGLAITNIDIESGYQQNTRQIKIWIKEGLLNSGLLEDLLFTSIAPIFRCVDYYFIHAFAVTHGDSALF